MATLPRCRICRLYGTNYLIPWIVVHSPQIPMLRRLLWPCHIAHVSTGVGSARANWQFVRFRDFNEATLVPIHTCIDQEIRVVDGHPPFYVPFVQLGPTNAWLGNASIAPESWMRLRYHNSGATGRTGFCSLVISCRVWPTNIKHHRLRIPSNWIFAQHAVVELFISYYMLQPIIVHSASWPNGKASDFGSEDCRFESCVGRTFWDVRCFPSPPA